MCGLRREYEQTTISVWQGRVVGSGLQTHALPPVLALCTSTLFLQFRFWWVLEKDHRRSPPQETWEERMVALGTLHNFNLESWPALHASPTLFCFFHFPPFAFLLIFLIHLFYTLLLGSLSFPPFWLTVFWAPTMCQTELHSGAQKGTKDKISALKEA